MSGLDRTFYGFSSYSPNEYGIPYTEDIGANNPGASADEAGLSYVAKARAELGLPERGADNDKSTVAVLVADDQEIWGVSAHGQGVKYKVNPVSKGHAETDALNQLAQSREVSGKTGGTGTMFVDRDPCHACATSGLYSMGRAAGLEGLRVVYPSGTRVYEF